MRLMLRASLAAVLLGTLLAAVAVAVAAAPAPARTGACLVDSAGPTCRIWTGTVRSVNDGDTVGVDLDGDGSRRLTQIRFTAIQAMELTRYNPRRRRGQCHAVAATTRLEQVLRRGRRRVRLAAERPRGRDPLGRFRRTVAVRIGGRWRDLGEILVREGHALWMPNAEDVAWNARYNRAQQEARRRGRRLWNPVQCGRGPQQDVPIEVWVNSDPVGIDAANVDGEWIKVWNRGSGTLDLGRWWVRDAMQRRFTFPAGTRVAPGAAATVSVGRGGPGHDVFHWGLSVPIFENAGGDGRDLGDGAFLFDPQGDLRQAMLYPCVVDCRDPRQGALVVEAEPRRPERLRVRNLSGAPVDLHGLLLGLGGSSYAFEAGAVVPPRGEMVVEVQGDPREDTALRRHWGVDRNMLVDSGGSIDLRTHAFVRIACDAWGDGSCDRP